MNIETKRALLRVCRVLAGTIESQLMEIRADRSPGEESISKAIRASKDLSALLLRQLCETEDNPIYR